MALADGIEAEVDDFVAVVGLPHGSRVARAFPMQYRGNGARALGVDELAQPGGNVVGEPPAVLQLDQRYPLSVTWRGTCS